MNNNCEECNNQILPARAELGYTTCISCASKKPHARGVMVFDKNLNSTLQIVSDERFNNIKSMYDAEKLTDALNQYEF